MVEGGKQLLDSFITQNLWDEARVFTGNKRMKSGIFAPKIPIEAKERYNLGSDQVHVYQNKI